MPLVIGDHAARVAAAIDWLTGLCGDYAPLRRQFIAAYFSYIATQLDAHRADLVERLNPYDGLLCTGRFPVVGAHAVATRMGTGRRPVVTR